MHRHVDLRCPTFIPARAQPIAEDLFPSPDGRLDFRTPVVTREGLPGHAARLGDTPEMAVALGWRGVSGSAWHRRSAGWHDHRRVRVTVGDGGVNTVLIVGPIPRERGQRIDDLIEQRADLSAVIDIFGGQRRGHDLAAAGIDADVQLAPGTAGLCGLAFYQPLPPATPTPFR